MLFFTGFSRHAHEIAKHKIANIGNREQHLRSMHAMVDEAQAILTDPNQDILTLGKLLHEGWRLKRELASAVSTSAIDEIYQAGCDAGAVGGKILGAGGGGFILFFVPPERQQSVRERLHNLIEVAVDIDTGGSSVVVYEPNGFSKAQR
jgi:D-glycero-alpha-D-manno-heptose-7-phosphate kinase